MKTHTIKTPTAELMIVELPENENTFNDLTFLNSETDGYTLLGKPDEIMEEDAELLVDNWKGLYIDYATDEPEFYTAKESLLSLLESEIYWDVNPIPTPEIQGGYDEFGNFHGGWDDNWISAFEEAEQKTFDRNRSLIFKKI